MSTEFNILDFGAVGDGKTDCTAAVQNALDKAKECMGRATVPPGKYLVGSLKMRGTGCFSRWSIGMVLSKRRSICVHFK